jgi:hypothetical protein
LLAEAKSLVARECIKAELLKELAGNHGYRNIAHDIAGLAHIFKTYWDAVKDQTGIRQAQIEEVEKLALKLTDAVAQREQSPEQVEAATEIRARIFTLFCRAYDEVRYGMQYLRRHSKDTDEIVPSLFTLPAGGTSKTAASADGTSSMLASPVADGVRLPIGLPGGDPMTN